MPRIRSVSPDICSSPTMARLTAEQERTFVRLWTHCDDAGRARDDPLVLSRQLYQAHRDMTERQLADDLEALRREGLIYRYEVDGKHYLQVRSWGDFQHPQHPAQSKIPPMPENGSSPPPTRGVREPHQDDQESSRKPHEDYASPTRSLMSTPVRRGEELSRSGVGGEGSSSSASAQPDTHPVRYQGRWGERTPVHALTGIQLFADRWGVDPNLSTHEAVQRAVADVCGFEVEQLTMQARRGFNGHIRQLLEVHATPREVYERAENYHQWFPDAPLTPNALVNHWAQCANPPPPPRERPSGKQPIDRQAGIKAFLARQNELNEGAS